MESPRFAMILWMLIFEMNGGRYRWVLFVELGFSYPLDPPGSHAVRLRSRQEKSTIFAVSQWRCHAGREAEVAAPPPKKSTIFTASLSRSLGYSLWDWVKQLNSFRQSGYTRNTTLDWNPMAFESRPLIELDCTFLYAAYLVKTDNWKCTWFGMWA